MCPVTITFIISKITAVNFVFIYLQAVSWRFLFTYQSNIYVWQVMYDKYVWLNFALTSEEKSSWNSL